MSNLLEQIKNYLKNFDKNKLIKIGLFLIPLLGIVLKAIFLQGFIQNQNPYDFNISLGFSNASPFINYYYAYTLSS